MHILLLFSGIYQLLVLLFFIFFYANLYIKTNHFTTWSNVLINVYTLVVYVLVNLIFVYKNVLVFYQNRCVFLNIVHNIVLIRV